MPQHDPNPNYEFETKQIHAGQRPDPVTNAITVPIYASTAFVWKSAQHIEDVIEGGEKAFVYARMGNPTNATLEQRLAELEGGNACTVTSSGAAAVMLTVFALCKSGNNIVLPHQAYGGSHQQFNCWLPRLGIQGRFVDSETLEVAEFEKLIDENTRGIFVESITNPVLRVPDIEALAKLAHSHNIPLIVDATFTGAGYLMRPIDHGADIVIHSLTKWAAGHGQCLGGAVISSGKFEFTGPKWIEFQEPLAGYGDLILNDTYGPLAFIQKARMETLRELGACLSADSAFKILTGLETLSLRMDRHTANALALTEWLVKHPHVAWVSHPSLPDHPSYVNAKKYLPRGAGGMVSFALKNDPKGVKGQAMIDQLNMAYHCNNVGDVRTLVSNPAKTVQRQLSPANRLKSGTPDDLIRVSAGLENPRDIIADFEHAIKAVMG